MLILQCHAIIAKARIIVKKHFTMFMVVLDHKSPYPPTSQVYGLPPTPLDKSLGS